MESDTVLRKRMKELELSYKALLVMTDQLHVKLHRIEKANARVKGKLRDIQEDLIALIDNQEKSEKKQKEKLRWLQEQLKTKEDEIKSQSEYFEHYKQRQRQQTAVLRERECYLRGEVSRLEKQVLDLSAHTALLTSELEEGMVQYLQQKLESAFGGTLDYEHSDMEVMELKTCIQIVEHDMKSHLEAFQQNFKFLRKKEDDNRREQADLLTELQCSQDTEDFLRRQLEESSHLVYTLKLSEIKLHEKIDKLLDENRALKDHIKVKLKKRKEKDSGHQRLENENSSIDLVTIGTNRTGTQEDNPPLFRCTPSYCAPRLLLPCSKLANDEATMETTDEENLFLLTDQPVNLPAKTFPASVAKDLMIKKLQLTLFEPESYHVSAVTTVKEVSLDLSEENTTLCSDGLCLVAEGFSDKTFALGGGNMPCTVTEIFTSSLEKCNVEKRWGNKKILPKNVSENKCPDKIVDDGKYHQKIFKGRAEGEEIQSEKAQPQQAACLPEESSELLNKTELTRPGNQGMVAKTNLGSPQDVQNLSVHFKAFKKHFGSSPKLKEKEGNVSGFCISEVNRVHSGEDIVKMEEKGEQPHKPACQANSSSNIGLKENNSEQTLTLCESNEKNDSSKKITAENMQYTCSPRLFWSEEEGYLLNLASSRGERAVCLTKMLLSGSTSYERFCHPSPLEAGSELEKMVAVCSQRIFLLIQENENYSKKVCMLQEENERYAQMMCALEEEMDAYIQYILAIDEANVVSFQNLLNEREVGGGCYNNLSEENTTSPGTLVVETFSKNLACVEEKNRNSERDSLTIASNKLPRSVVSLYGRKMRYFQLLSGLKEERNRCFEEIAKLLQDKENYVARHNELIQEREGNIQRISLLEGEKENLLRCLAEVKCEQDKYKTLVSELQECKTSCYQTISDLQEEKDALKREMARITKETSEQLDASQKANANCILENNKLKELMSSLGFSYEELGKEKSLGTKGKPVKLKESQQHGLNPKSIGTACSGTQTEEILITDPSSYFTRKEGSMSERCSVMKEQVEKVKEELKIREKELEQSKKEAQKWYRELGFAETRYEEVKTHLTQALSELDHLKQEAGNKKLGKQHSKLMPVYTVKDAQEIEENEMANKRLHQQVLTLKAQLRDQAALQNQFHDLQNEVGLLRAQLCEKEKELQKRKSEAKLTLAPLKAKLACLTRKCQERNTFIRRMHGEFHRRGIINSAFDEEVKNLMNDVALAEYSVVFTPMCDQEVLPSSTGFSQASGQPEDRESYVKVDGMTGSIPANSQQEVASIHTSCIAPNVSAASAVKLTSPERITALHRELSQNHHKSCQVPSAVSISNPKADCYLPMMHEEAPWPLLSRRKDALVPPEHGAFWATKGRDRLSKCDDVFWGQVGNQHAGAIPQGLKQKNSIMNKAWLSREKTDGSTSATTAKSYLSDVLSASNKGRNPVGRNQLHGKE